MWLITTFGFFSVVQKRGTTHLTIRSRVRGDLEQLKQRYLPSLGPIQDSHESGKHTDYRYRAAADHEAVALAMAAAVRDIGYDNFKNEVGKRQGYDRAEVYSSVWGCLYELQQAKFQVPAAKATAAEPTAKPADKATAAKPTAADSTAAKPTTKNAPSPTNHPSHLTPAYGTVVYDPATQKVLIRAPKNGYGDMKWTLPKGRPDPGESPEQTATRETREETGFTCELLATIPGEYRGQTTINRYWLAIPVGSPSAFDPSETAEVRWVDQAEAASLIGQSKDKRNVERDLAVIDAALRLVADGALDQA